MGDEPEGESKTPEDGAVEGEIAFDQSVLVYNERIKYTATWLNTIAAGAIIAGFVAPLANLAAGNASQWTILLSLIWLPAGVTLHWVVRIILADLKSGA